MAQTGARSLGTAREDTTGRTRRRGMTPAQWYCLLAGLGLLLAGIFGFLADASFDTSSTTDADRLGNADGQLQGDGFLGFEVNAWHNIVHVLSGVVLLATFSRRRPAKAVALTFGLVYGAVAIIGLIDGDDVLGIIPINAADNILHVALSALGVITSLVSRGDHDAGNGDTSSTADRRAGVAEPSVGRFSRTDRQDVARRVRG